ncbi:MAG: NAD(P)-binding protein [Polyangiaceae bacterium]|nr:NAD(P)-binding protein [Polyangiaceae bacterium]
MPSEENEVVDVVIVGAGFTGISAARELADLGVSFRVLDSFSDHLGGRAYSYDPGAPPSANLRFDHGAEYIGDTQNEIMQLIKELLPADCLVNGAHMRHPYPSQIMILAGERYVFRLDQSLFGITGIPPQIGIISALGVIGLLAEMTLVEMQVNVLEPWKASDEMLELDQISIWDWLGQKEWVNPTVKDLMRISIEALLSIEPSEISPLYLLWYTACNNGLITEVNDDAGGPQQYWLKCGMSELAERFADPIRDHIRQGVRVSKIDLTGELVKVTTSTGEELRAKKVLVATSPHSAGRIEYAPEPSSARRALMNMPMGRTLKCQVFYKSQWWRDSNGTHFNGYAGGANYPVLWVMDNSPLPGVDDKTHVLMTFTVGAQLDALGPNPSEEQIITHVTGALRDMFDDDRALAGSDEYVGLRWYRWDSNEKFVGGGPNTVFKVGALTGDPGKIMNQHWDDKVFFASAENARNLSPRSKSPHYDLFNDDNVPKYTKDGILLSSSKPPFTTNYSDYRQSLGYMDGAIISGRYVANELADSLGRKNHLRAYAPAAKPAAAPPPCEDKPLNEVLGVLESLKKDIDALSHDDVRAWQERGAGPRGYVAWLQQSLTKALEGDDAKAADRVKRLTKLRDFAATAVMTMQPSAKDADKEPSLLTRIRGAFDDADSLLRKKLGL